MQSTKKKADALVFSPKLTTAMWDYSRQKGDRGLSTDQGVHRISLDMKPM